MNRHETEIEELLAAMRNAEPPSGLEQRVLTALQDRMAPKSHGRSSYRLHNWLIAPTYNFPALAACGTALITVTVLAVLVSHIRHPRPVLIQSRSTTASRPSSLHPNTNRAVAATAHVYKEHLQPMQHTPLQSRRRTFADQAESAAVSFPAPPMPLTSQEKLLLRIAHRNDPHDVDSPDADALNIEVAEAKADFDAFFQDPKTGENQWKQIVAQQAKTK